MMFPNHSWTVHVFGRHFGLAEISNPSGGVETALIWYGKGLFAIPCRIELAAALLVMTLVVPLVSLVAHRVWFGGKTR